MEMHNWSAIVVAAGRGSRFGRPKQLVELGGAPLVSWSLRTFDAMNEIREIVVVTERDRRAAVEEVLRVLSPRVASRVVEGGVTRQQSVACGLRALGIESHVLVHDGARPLVRAADVRSAMRVVRPGVAAVLGVPVVDTIKQVDPTTRSVVRTLDRSALWAAQTPQLATLEDLRRAHARAEREGVHGTDETTLLERAGVRVCVVQGSADNIKVTLPGDLAYAELLLRDRVEHAPSEEEVLLVEVFADESLVDAVCEELERRRATIDAIDRDLPRGTAVRAFVRSRDLHGFGDRFEAFASGDATFTARFSHYAGSAEPV